MLQPIRQQGAHMRPQRRQATDDRARVDIVVEQVDRVALQLGQCPCLDLVRLIHEHIVIVIISSCQASRGGGGLV